MNKEEKAAYMREYYSDPYKREKKRVADRAYAERNKEKALGRATRYYQGNTEKVKLQGANRRRDQKELVANLLGGKCQRCGFDHLAALDFHHKEPESKLFRISDAVTRTKQYSWEEIEAEVMKCELLCKNCHAIEHCTWEIENAKT